jgi:uncharacterized protein (TIGR03000 family)
MVKSASIAVCALALLFGSASSASAWGRWGGWGWGGWGYPYHGWGYGYYGGWHYPYYAGYYPYWGGYGGYWGYPYYYSYAPVYSYPAYSYAQSGSYTQSNVSPASYQSTSLYTPQDNSRAYLNVQVPSPDAKVWIEGQEMNQRGTRRVFHSPSLDPGYRYSYSVRAHWRENGEEKNQTKTVRVEPGKTADVSFTSQQ